MDLCASQSAGQVKALIAVNIQLSQPSIHYIALSLCECLHELTTPVVHSWGVLFGNVIESNSGAN